MTCEEARNLMLECLTGSTPPDARRALQDHLQTCQVCAAEAQGVEDTVALLRTVPDRQLSESQWGQFAQALQVRLAQETVPVWVRLMHWLRRPRVAWGTATATAALVAALVVSIAFRVPAPVAQTDLPLAWRAMVTDSMTRAAPSMTGTLEVWTAQLAETPADLELTGGD